eukprot:TRINITY_DN10320_c0_g1_i1.p1 TRINITY_DN10320_c0_g1~~TRINITY_DN10320_c0_g1_i1.p1  ORF type:complete len:582 (+),score=188.19 TRINITY_DN10320_c0_g1_i1:62-1747(+)
MSGSPRRYGSPRRGDGSSVAGSRADSNAERMYQWWWAYFGGSNPAEPKPEWRASMKRLSVRSRASKVDDAMQGESMKLLGAAGGGGLSLPDPILDDGTGDERGPLEDLETLLDAPPAAASVTSSVFNLCNVCLGAGTLSMPFAFSKVGIVGGLFILTLIYAFMVLSAMLLTDVAREQHIRAIGSTYGALIFSVWGRAGTIATNCVVVVATFGIAIAYFQLAGDLIAPPIGYWLGDTPKDYCNFFAEREGPIYVALGLQAVLCVMPTLNALRYVSLLAVVSMLYLTAIIVIRSGERWYDKPEDGDHFYTWRWTTGMFQCISICTFAFAPHIQMVTMFSELNNPTRARTFTWIIISFTLCWLVYGMVGAFGYYTFYGKTGGNIILNHKADDTAVTIGRLGVAVSVMAGYPMMMNPCCSALDALFFPNREPSIWGRRLVWMAFAIGATFGLALLIEDVSVVLGLTGAGALTVASFIIPGMSFITVFKKKMGSWSATPLLKCAVLVVGAGLVFGGVSIVVTIIDDIINYEGPVDCTWPINCPTPQRCCPPNETYGPPLSDIGKCP